MNDDSPAPALSPAERSIINASRTRARAAFVAGALALARYAIGRELTAAETAAMKSRAEELYSTVGEL